jgi:hypothetical protein
MGIRDFIVAGALMIAMLIGPGCASTERAAAERLDLTHEIVQQASSLFAADKELSAQPIEVDGFKGAMRLRGQVSSPAQKSRAEKIVWALRGVRSVENQLQVSGLRLGQPR